MQHEAMQFARLHECGKMQCMQQEIINSQCINYIARSIAHNREQEMKQGLVHQALCVSGQCKLTDTASINAGSKDLCMQQEFLRTSIIH